MGGLTCGGLLSRAGQRVVILEQHYLAGGCTHVFKEKGVEFDTGIHYGGSTLNRNLQFSIFSKNYRE